MGFCAPTVCTTAPSRPAGHLSLHIYSHSDQLTTNYSWNPTGKHDETILASAVESIREVWLALWKQISESFLLPLQHDVVCVYLKYGDAGHASFVFKLKLKRRNLEAKKLNISLTPKACVMVHSHNWENASQRLYQPINSEYVLVPVTCVKAATDQSTVSISCLTQTADRQ